MSLYDDLGVKHSAAPEEIRAAWIDLCKALHPDVGGADPDRLRAVNHAYEVLSEPNRRARYDKTGVDEDPKAIRREAEAAVSQVFSDIVSQQLTAGAVLARDTDIVGALRAGLYECAEKWRSESRSAKAALARLRKMRKCVRGPIIERVLDQKVVAAEKHVAFCAKQSLVGAEALAITSDYLFVSGKPEFKNETPYLRFYTT